MNGENKTIMGIVVVLVGLALIAAIFFITRNNPTTTTNTTNTQTTNSVNNTTNTGKVTVAESKTFSMNAQNGSGQNGTVMFEEAGNQVQVIVTLSNPTTNSEPAHIHLGSCPTPGSIIFGLSDVVNGSSVTLVDTTLAELKSKGAIAVNVHKSSAEAGTYYSCADVVL